MPVWGMSPCSVPEGGYSEFGVKAMGVRGINPCCDATRKRFSFGICSGASRRQSPEIDRALRHLWRVWVLRLVTVATGKIARKYLALDQG